MTLYRKCERCHGRAGWTDPNSLEWVECEADGCDLGMVPVEEPVYHIERCGHGRIDPHTFWIDYTRTGPQPSPTQPHQSAVQCDGGIVVRIGGGDAE